MKNEVKLNVILAENAPRPIVFLKLHVVLMDAIGVRLPTWKAESECVKVGHGPGGLYDGTRWRRDGL